MSNPPPSGRFSSQRENDAPLDLDAVYNRTDQFGRRIRTEEELTKQSKSAAASVPPNLVTHIVEDDEDDVVLVSDSSDCTVLLIEDLPSFTSEQDIMKMFSDFSLLHIVLARKPKHFHAYVKFLNKEDAAIALKVKYNHRIGYKQVFVSECSDHIYEQAKSEFSIDPIPTVQSSPENQDDVSARRPENSNDEGSNIKYPRSQLFQKQFVEPTQSFDLPFGTGDAMSNVNNVNLEIMPPPIIEAGPNKFVANNSDPRKRKLLENHPEQRPQHPDFGHFQNQPPFGESYHQKTRFGESHQNTVFGEPHENGGFIDSRHNNDFGGPSQFDGFGNNPNHNSQFSRQQPNNVGNVNFQQRPSDPRQKKNPFVQPPPQQQTQPEQQPLPEANVVADTPFIFATNIDFRSSVKEIQDWFAEISVYPKEIYRMVNFRGLPNGKCVFLCNSPQEANLGMAKNRLKFRSRVVYMNLMPVAHAAEALATLGVVINPNDFTCEANVEQNQHTDNNKPKAKNVFNKNTKPEEPTKKVPSHKNPFMQKPKLDDLPDEVLSSNDFLYTLDTMIDDVNANANEDLDEDVMEGGQGEEIIEDEEEDEEHDEAIDNNGEEDGDGEFENTEFVENEDGGHDQEHHQDDDNPMLNHFDNNGPPFDHNMMNNMHHNQRNYHQQGGNHMMNHGMNPNMHNNHPPPSQRNTNGCVVALRNVPFQANAIDIMRFFNNYQLGADDIIRRYRDDGSPTGDARVCFASPMDAMAAVEQCQNGRIMNRIVQMRLFS